jgi:hypothetical protein
VNDLLSTFESGGVAPKNELRLREFVELGAEAGHVRSLLAKAAYVQDISPETSRSIYEQLGRQDHCLAQAMLAASYCCRSRPMSA